MWIQIINTPAVASCQKEVSAVRWTAIWNFYSHVLSLPEMKVELYSWNVSSLELFYPGIFAAWNIRSPGPRL